MMATAVERTRLVLSVMLSGSGRDEARINDIPPTEVKAVVDEILEHQTRGGRRLLGLQVDPSLAPGLDCPPSGRGVYRSVAVTGYPLGTGTLIAVLAPAP